MKKEEKIAFLKVKYEKTKKEIMRLDIVVPGTIMKRTITRENETGKKNEFGPYYQWTRKIKGRTVNKNLAEMKAASYMKAIKNNRKLDKLIDKLRKISLEILDLQFMTSPK